VSDHVVGDIVDYLEGRLDPDREQVFENHLAECAECATDYAVALQFHEHGVQEGLRHLDAERIAVLASELESRITEFEQRHLDDCEDCRTEYEWAKAHPGEVEWDAIVSTRESARRVDTPRKSWRWGWKPVGVGLAAAAAAILLIIALPDRHDISELARIEPLPVRISRASVTPGTFEAFRLRGLELYRSGDYEAALEHLGRAFDAKPEDDEVPLYIGSAHLMLGQPQDAARFFKSVSNKTSNDAIREECLWQLANAQIAAGLIAAANSTLDEVSSAAGPHAADARGLLEELAEAPDTENGN
jgi:tetratricopeptide (TPR) repeat protein